VAEELIHVPHRTEDTFAGLYFAWQFWYARVGLTSGVGLATTAKLKFLKAISHRKRIGEGDQRGGQWEPIKILLENLAYITKSTRRPSLLTRPRPHSYSTAIGPRNRARNCSGNTE
jgi:hypothetical protein